MKNKGKIHPSPPPPLNDSLSVLNLLPSTILVLVSVLSSEDKEVLSYLITRGTDRDTSSSSSKKKKNKKEKKKKSDNKSSKNHKPPVFDCECFDCYTNYWFRWDKSPNRELIHEIIDAFENHQHQHLSFLDSPNNKSKKGKKKEKPGRRVIDTKPEPMTRHVSSPGRLSEADVAKDEAKEEKSPVVYPAATVQHKGLARKVLPDLFGLFKSNFWRLWNPNAYVSMT